MSYLLIHNKLHLKYSGLKQHLVGRSSSGSSGLAYFRVLAADAASSEYSDGEDLLLVCVVAGRIQQPTGYRTEGLSSSLVVGQNLPSVSCLLGFSPEQFTTWQLTSSE